MFAKLSVKAAQRCIIVDGASLDALYGGIGLPAKVQQRKVIASDVPHHMIVDVDIGGRIERDICYLAERVAWSIRWPDAWPVESEHWGALPADRLHPRPMTPWPTKWLRTTPLSCSLPPEG